MFYTSAGGVGAQLSTGVVVVDRDLTEEDGEMTATLKIKRNVVVDRFSKEIQGMYAKS